MERENLIEKLKRARELQDEALFLTDFYQLPMSMVYILEGRENEEVVFECFVRNIRAAVNPKMDMYIFGGEEAVHNYMSKIREILEKNRDKVLERFLEINLSKVKQEEKRAEYEKRVRAAWENIAVEFEYSVLKEGMPVYSSIPVFSYRGPRWIGQLIETMVNNIVNGKTGYNTLEKNGLLSQEEKGYFKLLTASLFDSNIEKVINNENLEQFNNYYDTLVTRAKEYREATEKDIMEAAFRRAPGYFAGVTATIAALENGWNGTSNLTAYFAEKEEYRADYLKKWVGGSFAHSFVMGHKEEIDAFKTWLKYFPDSILLIDTYSVEEAANKIVENDLNPMLVRIDSEPLDEYAFKVKKIFEKAGKNIGIYLSSDITPEMLEEFNRKNIPYNRLMAGTKYVNINGLEKLNCGFVYKITVNNVSGELNLPEKKATGKKNYPGAKFTTYDCINGKVTVRITKQGQIGYEIVQDKDNGFEKLKEIEFDYSENAKKSSSKKIECSNSGLSFIDNIKGGFINIFGVIEWNHFKNRFGSRNREPFMYEVVNRQESVALLLLDSKGEKLFLIKQFRPGALKEIWEIPAAIMGEGESAEESIRREINEKCGYSENAIDSIEKIGSGFVSPGYTTEYMHLFCAKIRYGAVQGNYFSSDENKDIRDRGWFTFEEASEAGIYEDMKSGYAVSKYMIEKRR